MFFFLVLLLLGCHVNLIFGSFGFADFFKNVKEKLKPSDQPATTPSPKEHRSNPHEPEIKIVQPDDVGSFSEAMSDIESVQSMNEQRLLYLNIPMAQNVCLTLKRHYKLTSKKNSKKGPLNLFEFKKDEVNLDCELPLEEMPDPTPSNNADEFIIHSAKLCLSKATFLKVQLDRIGNANEVYRRNIDLMNED